MLFTYTTHSYFCFAGTVWSHTLSFIIFFNLSWSYHYLMTIGHEAFFKCINLFIKFCIIFKLIQLERYWYTSGIKIISLKQNHRNLLVKMWSNKQQLSFVRPMTCATFILSDKVQRDEYANCATTQIPAHLESLYTLSKNKFL